MLGKIMTNSRNTEVSGMAKLLCVAYDRSALLTDAVLTDLFKLLKETNNKLIEAIECSKVESLLFEKNGARNHALRGVAHLLKGYTYYPEQEVQNAAKAVKKVFDKYGLGITKESYVSESSHIISMLGDFDEPDMQNALQVLPGLIQNIAALKLAQDDFETTRAKYAGEVAKQEAAETASELKKEVIQIINNDLVVYLRNGQRFYADVYGAFAATVAIIIAANNEQVKRRQKKEKTLPA